MVRRRRQLPRLQPQRHLRPPEPRQPLLPLPLRLLLLYTTLPRLYPSSQLIIRVTPVRSFHSPSDAYSWYLSQPGSPHSVLFPVGWCLSASASVDPLAAERYYATFFRRPFVPADSSASELSFAVRVFTVEPGDAPQSFWAAPVGNALSLPSPPSARLPPLPICPALPVLLEPLGSADRFSRFPYQPPYSLRPLPEPVPRPLARTRVAVVFAAFASLALLPIPPARLASALPSDGLCATPTTRLLAAIS